MPSLSIGTRHSRSSTTSYSTLGSAHSHDVDGEHLSRVRLPGKSPFTELNQDHRFTAIWNHRVATGGFVKSHFKLRME